MFENGRSFTSGLIAASKKNVCRGGWWKKVRALRDLSSTAEKAIGLREIRALLAGRKLQMPECIAKIQQGTRRYAKRQLTWFQRQDNFEPLNYHRRLLRSHRIDRGANPRKRSGCARDD